MPDIVLALLAGVLTIAAPCTLPVLPILLGASVGQTAKAQPAFIALGFVISFAFVALALNAIARALNFDPDTLRTAGLVLLVIFGALMIWPALFERLATRFGSAQFAPSYRIVGAQTNFSGFVLGTTLGLIWTPCAGPVLGAILTAIATSADHIRGAALLLTYTLGAALPMLAVAYGGQAVTRRLRALAPYTHRLEQAFGVVVIAFALSAFLQYDAVALAWLSNLFPEGRVGL
jgi:cytochrome c biogenesis protein CcdA